MGFRKNNPIAYHLKEIFAKTGKMDFSAYVMDMASTVRDWIYGLSRLTTRNYRLM